MTSKISTLNSILLGTAAFTTETDTAQAGSVSTITLAAGASATDDFYSGKIIEITGGTGINQARIIISYVGSTKIATTGGSPNFNWTVTPIAGSVYVISGGFLGTFEDVSSFSQLTILTIIDTEGGEGATLKMDLAIDQLGANKNTKSVSLNSTIITAMHTLPIVSQYFRIRLIADTGDTLTGAIQTIYHQSKNKHLTNFLSETITDENDSEVVRSVIVSKTSEGVYENVQSTADGSLKISIENPRDAYGDVSITEMTPLIEVNFPYNINSDIVNKVTTNSATITQSSGMALVGTGTTTNSVSQVSSIRRIRYNPGMAIKVRFTGIFTTGIANTTQIIGIGDASDGFFFGYNETVFSILHRKGGALEIQILNISAGAVTATGDITITLNSVAKTVAITSGDSIHEVVNKIVATNFADTGNGWKLHADGDDVIFIALKAEVRGGTYTFVDTDTTGVAASFSQTQAGAPPIDAWIASTAWSDDNADNTATLPTIDFTVGNIYEIDFQWLGFGIILFGIENPADGRFVKVHRISYTNDNTTPSLTYANLPLTLLSDNGSTTSDMIVESSSMGGFNVGRVNLLLGPRRSAEGFLDGVSVSNFTNILTVRNDVTFQSTINKSEIMLLFLSISYEAPKGGQIKMLKNAILADPGGSGLTWTAVDVNISVVSYSTDAEEVTSGDLISVFTMGKNSSKEFSIVDLEFFLQPGDTITLATEPVTGTSAVDASASIAWVERQ